MRQISFQNRSIEFEFVRLDRFCCPEALTIAVQYLCAVLLFSFFFLWGAIKCDQGAIFRKKYPYKTKPRGATSCNCGRIGWQILFLLLKINILDNAVHLLLHSSLIAFFRSHADEASAMVCDYLNKPGKDYAWPCGLLPDLACGHYAAVGATDHQHPRWTRGLPHGHHVLVRRWNHC